MSQPIARLIKDGEERLAHSREELVALKYDGWREIKEAALAVVERVHPAADTSLTIADEDGDES